MQETTVNFFRENLKSEVDRCIESHEVLKVRRRNGEDFVVLSADDWKAIEETLYLNRIPEMAQKIIKASKEPLSKGRKLKDFKW